MAVNYFNKFPKVSFDVNNDGSFSLLTDITKTVDINTFDEDNVTYYTFQEIGDGERPDSFSYRLYGTPQYYWTFFVVNDSLKAGLHNSWPLSSHEFESMMVSEYDNYSAIVFNPILFHSLNEEGFLNEGIKISDFSVIPLVPINDFLTSEDNEDEYLPYLRLSAEIADSPNAKILKYDNSSCQLVIYDIRDNVKTSVTITNGGSGYSAVPTVTFSAPPSGGTTATGIAVVGEGGSVTSVVITNPGSGYITNPTVTFATAPSSGTTATGTAIVSKPTQRDKLLNETTFKLSWVNPYTAGTNDYILNEALKARFFTEALKYFKDIDPKNYPGNLPNDQEGSTPQYEDGIAGREKYIFDKIFIKEESYPLYRNAPAQYTSTQTIIVDGESVLSTIPVSVYDLLYPKDPSANPIPIDVLSFYEKENQINDDKRKIKVIRPQVINRFSKTYFDLLNS